MSTGDVEFIDEPERPPVDPSPARHRAPVLRALAMLGWVAAAVLAMLAPFQAVYGGLTLPRRYADYLNSVPLGVDGWGRAAGNASGGVRFGVALTACAAIFAILAVLGAVRLLRGTPSIALRRSVTMAAVGGPCLLAGVVGTLGLYVDSVTSGSGPPGWTIYAPTQPQSTAGYSSELRVSVTSYPVGKCLWLGLAALGCAVLATIAHLLADRADRRLAG